jgi:hypothetical protein
MIHELTQKLDQKQQQIDLLLQFLPKNIKSQLETHALNVENDLKEEDPVENNIPEAEDQDTNLNQSEQKSSGTLSEEKENLSEI